MTEEALAAGAEIADIMVCPHGWDEGCACRKPAPGMLFAAQRRHHLDLSRTPLFGDDARDGAAAQAAGCPHLVLDGNIGLLEAVDRLLDGRWAGPWRHP
jgi:D-glycero-D-manno-heptose 1,7-bisphosphate phosphatase